MHAINDSATGKIITKKALDHETSSQKKERWTKYVSLQNAFLFENRCSRMWQRTSLLSHRLVWKFCYGFYCFSNWSIKNVLFFSMTFFFTIFSFCFIFFFFRSFCSFSIVFVAWCDNRDMCTMRFNTPLHADTFNKTKCHEIQINKNGSMIFLMTIAFIFPFQLLVKSNQAWKCIKTCVHTKLNL